MDLTKTLEDALELLSTNQIKSKQHLKEEIYTLTGHCGDDVSFPARVWLVRNRMASPPSCPVGNSMKFTDGKVGYQFCGRVGSCECATQSQRTKLSATKRAMDRSAVEASNSKRRDTNMARYGVEHASQHPDSIAKLEQTNRERYGVASNLSLDATKDKIRQTNRERYGTESAIQNPDIASKVIETKKKRHGEDWSLKEREKSRETMLSRYGVSHALQNDEFMEKRNETTRQRWGDSNHMKNPEILDRARATIQDRYGVPSFNQIGYDENDVRLVGDRDFFIGEYNRLGRAGILENYNVSRAVIRNKVVEYGLPRDLNLSSSEEIISQILDDAGVAYRVRCRDVIAPLELDFYLCDYNLAIEVCGLYWHCENSGNKKRSYHLEKTTRCDDKNIRLITIFDDELSNVSCVRSRLENALGIRKKICGARNTTIREISVQECRDFLMLHHTQGYCRSSVRLGAFHNDVLVGVMSMVRPRIALGTKNAQEGDWEIARMANLGVPGLNSKFMAYFTRMYKPISVISFCDRRWGNGETYRKMGMEFVHNSPPNYWYFDKRNNKRLHRYGFTKGKLVAEGYPARDSEWTIMQSRGWDRIWDCGNSKWRWIS